MTPAPPDAGIAGRCSRKSPTPQQCRVSRCKSSLVLLHDLCYLCIQPTKFRPGQKTYRNDFEILNQNCKHFEQRAKKGKLELAWNTILGSYYML